MSYFEAWAWLRNNGWTSKELDAMKISQVRRLGESKEKKK